jgi:hypothetical protein
VADDNNNNDGNNDDDVPIEQGSIFPKLHFGRKLFPRKFTFSNFGQTFIQIQQKKNTR